MAKNSFVLNAFVQKTNFHASKNRQNRFAFFGDYTEQFYWTDNNYKNRVDIER